MVYGKLTCNRCGSNLLSTSGGVASCGSCGAALYRA
jgi:ribosomal protein S27E